MQFVVQFHTLLHQAEAGLNEEELLPGPILFHILAHSLSGSLIYPRAYSASLYLSFTWK